MTYKQKRRHELKLKHDEEYYNKISADTLKTCKRCSREKSILDFPKSKGSLDGFDIYCKKCKASARKRRGMEHTPEFYKNLPAGKTIECSGCKIAKKHTLFYKDKGSATGFHKICKECSSNEKYYESRAKAWFMYYDNNINEKRQKSLETYYKNRDRCKDEPWKRLYSYAKKRSRINNIPFNITPEYLKSIWNYKCPILGIELLTFPDKKYACENSPSIDRINPEYGYVKGNVCIISHKANLLKNNGSLDDHRRIVEYIESNSQESI